MLLGVVDRDAEDIGGKQVRGSLDALKGQADREGQTVGQGGLANSRHVLEQNVASRQQTHDGHAHDVVFALDNLFDVLLKEFQVGMGFLSR